MLFIWRWGLRFEGEAADERIDKASVDKAEAAGPVGLVYLTNSIFGKSLLLHAQWHGLLDLTNPEQRDRARHYGHPSSR